MNQDIKIKWLKDLRTPGLVQIRGFLEKTNEKGQQGNCCLGRLCRVAGITPESTDAKGTSRFLDCIVMPPAKVRYIAGLTEKQSDELAGMNDTGKNFFEIANWIEKNL